MSFFHRFTQKTVFVQPLDIIIPFHGQYDKLLKLIESIIIYVKMPHHLTVVDDSSEVNMSSNEIFQKIPMQYIRTKEHSGYSSAAKMGFDNTSNPLLLFIHSDCIFQDHMSLVRMLDALKDMKKDNVRMIGACFDKVMSGDERQIYDKDRDKNITLDSSKDEFLSTTCFLCHRELFKRLGFFKDYKYGWYEDLEFSKRMSKFGHKQAICSNAYFLHEGAATVKDIWYRGGREVKETMEKTNYERCVEDIKKMKIS